MSTRRRQSRTPDGRGMPEMHWPAFWAGVYSMRVPLVLSTIYLVTCLLMAGW